MAVFVRTRLDIIYNQIFGVLEVRTALLICVLTALLGGFTACSRTPSAPEEEVVAGGGSEPRDGPKAPEKAPKNQGEDPKWKAEQGLNDILKRIRASQDTYEKKVFILEKFIENAKLLEVKEGVKIPAIQRANQEIKNLKKSLDEEALTKYRDLEKKLEPLIGGDSPDFNAANALVSKFPVQNFEGSVLEKKFEDLKAYVYLCSEAEMEFYHRQSLLRDDNPVWNVAVMEGFDPKFERTPFYEKVQDIINKNYAKYIERRKEDLTLRKEATWEDVDVREFQLLWPTTNYQVKAEKDEITVGPNRDDYDERDTAGTCIQFGLKEWLDVELTLEAQVVDCGRVYFGARGHESVGGAYNFSWKGLGDLKIDDEEWHPLTVKIEGTMMEILDATGKNASNDRIRLRPGPFGIRVVGDKASIKIRKLKVWVKKREGSSEKNTEEDKGGEE